MPTFLVPLYESNDCHNPAGPDGGQFCGKSGSRTVHPDDVKTERPMAVATGGASIIAHHAAGRMPLDAAKVKRMEKAIRAGESFDPLVVREDGVLRDGHHRLQAYRNVGTKSIEVVSEDEAKRRKLKWRV